MSRVALCMQWEDTVSGRSSLESELVSWSTCACGVGDHLIVVNVYIICSSDASNPLNKLSCWHAVLDKFLLSSPPMFVSEWAAHTLSAVCGGLA